MIKENYEPNSFTFNHISLFNSLSKYVDLYLQIKINKQDVKESLCIIDKEKAYFNIACKIHNYCENNNIDIKIEKMQKKSNMSIIVPDTIYIKIPSDK